MIKASLHDQLYVLALVYTNDIEKLQYLIENYIIDIDFDFNYNLPVTNEQNVIDIINELLLINGFFDDLHDFMKKNRLFKILFKIYNIEKLKPNQEIRQLFEADFDENSYESSNTYSNENVFVQGNEEEDEIEDLDLEKCDFFEMTLLKVAVIMEYEEMVKFLLDNGSRLSFDNIDRSDIHPLHLSLYQNNATILKILLDKLNDKEIKNKSINKLIDKNGFNPLHLAIFNQNIEAIDLLYEAGADFNHRVESVSYPLIWAMETGDVSDELIGHLLSLGANPNLIDQAQGVSPLNVAILTNKIELVKLLVLYGANVNQSFDDHSNNSLKLAIEIASQNNDTRVIEILLESGADVNLNFNYNTSTISQNIPVHPNRNYATTPLITAISLNNEKIVELLLKYGAYPHTTPYDMYSPLSSACFLNNKAIVDLLLSYKIDPTLSSYQSNHPLTVCLSKNYIELAESLFVYYNSSELLNKQNKNGDYALLFAALNKNTKMIRKILEKGGNPDLFNNHNVCPLWNIVYNNDKASFFEIIPYVKNLGRKSCGIDYNDFQLAPELIFSRPLAPIEVAEVNEAYDLLYYLFCIGIKASFELREKIKTKLALYAYTLVTNIDATGDEDLKKIAFIKAKFKRLKILDNALNRPLSLKRLCRNKIRNTRDLDDIKKVLNTEMIPNTLKDFINLVKV